MATKVGTDQTSPEFRARLRRPPSASSVTGSLAVLFFGDLLTAKAVSVGLNPSKQEYLDRSGSELTGDKRRFETLGSLGCRDRSSLTDEQCDRAIEKMRAYFRPGKPVYGWFRPLSRVMEGMGYRYLEGEAAHLDLVQEATDPTWSRLKVERPDEVEALLEADLAFLKCQIGAFPLQVIVCNGRTVFDTVSRILGAELRESGALARIRWYASTARVGGRGIGVVGWNLPLAGPTGLGAEGERELGQLLASQLERGASLPVRDPKATCSAGDMRGKQVKPEAMTKSTFEHKVGTQKTHAKAAKAAKSKGRRCTPSVTEHVSRDQLFRLVRTRRRQVRRFLNCANQMEADGESLRWDARRDIDEAREAAGWFAEPWWGVVVFTCFGSLRGAKDGDSAYRAPRSPPRSQASRTSIYNCHRVGPAPKQYELPNPPRGSARSPLAGRRIVTSRDFVGSNEMQAYSRPANL